MGTVILNAPDAEFWQILQNIFSCSFAVPLWEDVSFQYDEPAFRDVDPTKNHPVDSHRDGRTDVAKKHAQTNATGEVDRSNHISHASPSTLPDLQLHVYRRVLPQKCKA